MLDSSYLLQHLPQLVNSRQFRASKTSVNAYLQILMHDDTFTFDADQALTGIKPTLPDQKTTHTSHALLARDKQRYYTQQYQRWLAKLREESEQPLTPTQWQRLQTVLAELEAAALGAEQAQQTVSAQDDFSHLLTDWFDRLQQTTPSAPTQPTERKRELKAPRPTDQPPTLSGLSAPHAQLLSPLPEKPDEKTRALLDAIAVALDLAYPPRAIEHSDTRKAYLTQLAEYQKRGVGLTKTDRAQLMQLLCALQDVVHGDCERNFSAV